MRNTPILEEVIRQQFVLPKFWVNLLIGSLLSFVPLVNIFAFGYLYQVFRGVRRLGQPAMPPWHDWKELFIDGLRFTVVFLCYWIAPIFLAAGLGSIFTHFRLGIFSNILFLSILLFSNILFIAALSHYHTRENFRDLLDFRLILENTRTIFPKLLVSSILFLGIFLWLLPLYGFGLFGGFLLLLTYASLHHY